MDTVEELIKKVEQLYKEEKNNEIIGLLPDTLLGQYNSAELYAWRARAHGVLEDLENALLYTNKAISIDSKLGLAYRVRGRVYYNKKEFNKAFDDYNKAIELNPADSIAYTNRGDIWLSKKEYDKAIEDYTKAINNDPTYSRGYYCRALANGNKQMFDFAIADYNKVIELEPDYSEAYNNRGNIWYSKKENSKAFDDFEKAIEFGPQNSMAYNNRGIIWFNLKNYKKALEDYNKSIEIDPENAFPYRNRGMYYDEIEKDYENALKDYNKAIELNEERFKNLKYRRDEILNILKDIDDIYSTTFSDSIKDNIRGINDAISKCVKEIKGFAKTESATPVVHYTKLSTLENILKKKDSLYEKRRLRYYNVIYMNDPEEGKILFNAFSDGRIEEYFEKGKRLSETSVYLGSFLPVSINDSSNPDGHEDALVMWRTYGKDENKNEAAGCNIVIRGDFFDKDDEEQVGRAGIDKPSDGKVPQPLYKIIYYKNKEFKNEDGEKVKNSISLLEENLIKLIKIREGHKGKKKEEDYIDKKIFEPISKICYLFKSADYSFEEEVRVVHFMPLGNDAIKTSSNVNIGEPHLKLYIESNNEILPFIEKIYLGPKVPNHEHWSAYFDYIIRQRKKEENFTNDIEVRKSSCNFQ